MPLTEISQQKGQTRNGLRMYQQICIKDEKLYTYPILDMYNGEIITYTLSRSPNQRMVTDMLKKGI